MLCLEDTKSITVSLQELLITLIAVPLQRMMHCSGTDSRLVEKNGKFENSKKVFIAFMNTAAVPLLVVITVINIGCM